MEQLKQYFDLQKKVLEYFGYESGWTVLPLSDETDKYWFLEEINGRVIYSDVPITEEVIEAGKQIYDGEIYKDKVYRRDDYTMVAMDTNCDFNKFLMVFDNKKECKDTNLMQVYNECW